MTSKPARPPFEAVLAVAAVSFAILAAEIALTRSFSVLFRAPYVFLIVSGAIGGLGVGGLLIQFVEPREDRVRTWITGLCVLLAAAIAAPVLWLFASPWGREWVAHAEMLVVLLLPMLTFSIAGMLLSLILRQYAASGGFLYFVDLAAAAAAAPVSVLLLDHLGGLNVPLALAVLTAAVGLALALRGRLTAWSAVAGVVLVGLTTALVSNLTSPWITLPGLKQPEAAIHDPTHVWNTSTKPLFVELAQSSTSRVVRTDWTAVSRTDVVEDSGSGMFYIYTDGDVPTQMERWDGSFDTSRREFETFIGSYPYRLLSEPPRNVLAIGAGGGLDVLLARAYGAREIDAVEINPSIPAIVADPRFQHTYARVYREPGVRLVVDEGRSFLQRAGQYDVIYFACAKTATTQTGGVALLDNHLYTVEAFRDYWRHLSDRGIAALIVQEPFLIDRLFLTATRALREQGVVQPERHFLTVRLPDPRMGEGPYRHMLLLRKQPWTLEELPVIRRAALTNYVQTDYVPLIQPRGANGALFDPAAPLPAMRRALENQYQVPLRPGSPETRPAHLSIVTDDSPFYVDIAPGINPTVLGLVWGTGVAVVLVLAAVLGIAWRVRKTSTGAGGFGPLGATVLYFAMLGAGFMLVELALMQRFVLLLGFPTRALSVSLFSLLISSALGAVYAQRGEPADAGRRLTRALPVLVIMLLLYRWALGPALEWFLPHPLPVRVLATAALMFPAGFLMGMPFPTALRTLSGWKGRLIPAFWSVNGIASIAGSVLTMVVAKASGYGTALLAGALCYAVAWVAFSLMGSGPRVPASSTEMTVSPR